MNFYARGGKFVIRWNGVIHIFPQAAVSHIPSYTVGGGATVGTAEQ